MVIENMQIFCDLLHSILGSEDQNQARAARLILDFLSGSANTDSLPINSALWTIGLMYRLNWTDTNPRVGPWPKQIEPFGIAAEDIPNLTFPDPEPLPQKKKKALSKAEKLALAVAAEVAAGPTLFSI